MNDIINKFLLAGDKFMPELHLKGSIVSTYSACGPSQRIQRFQKFMKTGHTRYIYRNQLDKACFQHDMAYDFKHLEKRTYSDKVLNDLAFKVASVFI